MRTHQFVFLAFHIIHGVVWCGAIALQVWQLNMGSLVWTQLVPSVSTMAAPLPRFAHWALASEAQTMIVYAGTFMTLYSPRSSVCL